MSRYEYPFEPLPAFPCGARPQVLLLGNGIGRLGGGGQSWEAMIADILRQHNSPYTVQDLRGVPASFQAVIASGDRLDDEMKNMAAVLCRLGLNAEQEAACRGLLGLKADAVLTTNYSFEPELAAGERPTLPNLQSLRRSARPAKNKAGQFGLYKYFLCGSGEDAQRIWHIHGEALAPAGMIMGPYYYGKLLGLIQEQVPDTIRRWKTCRKKNLPFRPESWVDYFLPGDVYILGLGLYLCEEDLWWLLCCKKRNFPESKVYFYPGKDPAAETLAMLGAYGAEIVSEIPFTDFPEYYARAIADIRGKIRG